jgi:hypothetical protein
MIGTEIKTGIIRAGIRPEIISGAIRTVRKSRNRAKIKTVKRKQRRNRNISKIRSRIRKRKNDRHHI